MDLLKKMCQINAVSGDELLMNKFILKYVKDNSKSWLKQPRVYFGDGFQENIILVFGKPRTAIFAHIDSIGFTVRYNNEIVKIGGPVSDNGIMLVGKDSKGDIEGKTIKKNIKGKEKIYIDYDRKIDRGTNLTFKVNYRETENFIQSSYLDNRLGVWNALKICENLNDGIICFSTWEEHGGGSVGYLADFIYKKYQVSKALISDITWITDGVSHGKGAVVSLRDSGIPRKVFVNRIVNILRDYNITFQLEVENAGGSDGNQLQKSPYPFDWCFIGAAEDYVHSPNEKVHKSDIDSMLEIYKLLMQEL